MKQRIPLRVGRRGATALTYGLVVGLVGIAGLSAVTRVGSSVEALFGRTSSTMVTGLETKPTIVADFEPDNLAFANSSNVTPSATVESATVTLSGFNQPLEVSVSGDGNPEVNIAGAGYGTRTTIENGETLRVRLTAAASYLAVSTATITIGSAETTWTVTTESPGTFSFSTCGATFSTGPSQSACNNTYAGSNLQGDVSVSGGYQSWVVPVTGTYRIEAWGGQGGRATSYSYQGGQGARMRGDFSLTQGETLLILVGQQAQSNSHGGGGGGGSFVTRGTSRGSSTLLLAAGGGGGAGTSGGRSGYHGTTSTSGSSATYSGGSGGNGGSSGNNSGWGGGGAGFSGNGGPDNSYGGTSYSFRSGGTGGPRNHSCGATAQGGFGGGGGCNGGGGGGGYSGGGAGGGGGGSYNGGSSQSNSSGSRSGNGAVTITYLAP